MSRFRQKATSDLNWQSGQDAAPRLSRAERHLDAGSRLEPGTLNAAKQAPLPRPGSGSAGRTGGGSPAYFLPRRRLPEREPFRSRRSR